MATYSKFGFLTGGSGGNPTGISDKYIRPLDAAGVPAVVGCLDGTVGLSDVLALNSSVPHVMYFRVVRDRSEGTSVPEYHHPPDVAARLHWDKIRPHIPPEIAAARDRIWVTPVNEVDVNMGSWLGYFSLEIGRLMRAEGFRQAAFGWAAGQPGEDHQEIEFWEMPGMLAYLRMCEADPEYYGIALHEGSFTVDHLNIDQWHIGRLEFLHEACDRNGIRRPPILITEFAWEMNKAPAPAVAMEHLKPVAEYYARFPNVLGAFLWCLCNYEDGKIANMVNRLIEPITQYTLSTVFPDPEPPKEQEPVNELETAIWEASLNLQDQRGINWNPGFGFPTAVRDAGYWPATNETPVLIGGVQYVIIVAEHPQKQGPRKVWAYKVPWGSAPVIELTDPNA